MCLKVHLPFFCDRTLLFNRLIFIAIFNFLQWSFLFSSAADSTNLHLMRRAIEILFCFARDSISSVR